MFAIEISLIYVCVFFVFGLFAAKKSSIIQIYIIMHGRDFFFLFIEMQQPTSNSVNQFRPSRKEGTTQPHNTVQLTAFVMGFFFCKRIQHLPDVQKFE
jgi:hypothetical protein